MPTGLYEFATILLNMGLNLPMRCCLVALFAMQEAHNKMYLKSRINRCIWTKKIFNCNLMLSLTGCQFCKFNQFLLLSHTMQCLVRKSTQHCGPLCPWHHFDNNQKLTDAMLVGLFVVVSGSHVCGRVRHHGGLCFGATPPRSEHQAAVAAASPRPFGELKKNS